MPPVVQLFALILGVVYTAVGLLGFIPGVVTGDLPGVVGPLAGNLVNLFAVNWLHSLTHLLIGLVGIAASRRYAASKSYALIIGLAYAGLFVLGILTEPVGTLQGYLPLNGADDVLHIVTALLLLGLFLFSRDKRRPATRR